MPGKNVRWVVEDYSYIERELAIGKPEIILDLLSLAYDLNQVVINSEGEIADDTPEG